MCGTAEATKDHLNEHSLCYSSQLGSQAPSLDRSTRAESGLCRVSVYINGLPFCVKDRKTPFGNVENTGVLPDALLASERQLQEDVLEEARQYESKILLHGERMPESSDGKVAVAAWGE